MGQAKLRGSREERIAQSQARAPQKAQKVSVPTSMHEILRLQQQVDRLFANLTTPTEINSQVLQFAQTLSNQVPVFLDCSPELWSRQSCCDSNVAKYAEDHGGEMLCGYRIWYNGPLYIEGERHAVWTNGEAIRDVSFVDSGETRILFVPDGKGFDDAPAKVRFAFTDADRTVLTQYEALEATVPVARMSQNEAWNTMPTYERWLAGERMPNMFPAISSS